MSKRASEQVSACGDHPTQCASILCTLSTHSAVDDDADDDGADCDDAIFDNHRALRKELFLRGGRSKTLRTQSEPREREEEEEEEEEEEIGERRGERQLLSDEEAK